MEPYDALPQPDPYSASRSAFERLISTLADSPVAGLPHDKLEEHLERSGRELLRQLMQDHLDLRARREEEAVRAHAEQLVVIGPEGQRRTWRETGHRRWLTCVFGPVRVNRIAYRGRGVANVHPADETLSLPAGRHSCGLARLAVLEAVRGSFDQADRAATEMTVQATAERLPATRREAVTTCHRYLTGHIDQLHYDIALTAGWPIATGAVEGACRHLIADRLDITGARWGLDGAEAVRRLRALITNSDFEDYWIYHTARNINASTPAPTSRTTASLLDPDHHFKGSAPNRVYPGPRVTDL